MRRSTRILLIAVVLIAVGAFAAYAGTKLVRHSATGPATHAAPPKTILILGTDLRPGWTAAHSDVIMVVHVDVAHHRLELMSIPRDTMVTLPGHGRQKINTAFFYGGPEGAVETVDNLLGVHIDGWAYTNFAGFRRIIDALGGVDVCVPEPMHYHASDVNIDLSAGCQHLNGEKVLEFVRYRELPLGDINREQDQQALLRALFHQAFSFGTILHLPTLVPELQKDVHTNLSAGQLLALAEELRQCRHGVLTETLPGAFLNLPIGGGAWVSYWDVVPSDARQAWQALLNGRTEPLMDPNAERNAESLGSMPNG
jgi:LCP family protein required for cell wall assembly